MKDNNSCNNFGNSNLDINFNSDSYTNIRLKYSIDNLGNSLEVQDRINRHVNCINLDNYNVQFLNIVEERTLRLSFWRNELFGSASGGMNSSAQLLEERTLWLSSWRDELFSLASEGNWGFIKI
ncbi:hypothetical protein C1645_812393 [Glomus cerebriforme]|uniref:Uncharacterized protein n=1 Tax=Glomus cerebriforme TaxID=658196 RepID=A0A397TMR6_9GLOM|nr:hypothetical protein C1645_812393 [Glomus cerebriforme]